MNGRKQLSDDLLKIMDELRPLVKLKFEVNTEKYNEDLFLPDPTRWKNFEVTIFNRKSEKSVEKDCLSKLSINNGWLIIYNVKNVRSGERREANFPSDGWMGIRQGETKKVFCDGLKWICK